MDKKLSEIITKSTYSILPGEYRYAKAAELPSSRNFFLLTQDAHEITLVVKEDDLANFKVDEVNKEHYALIALNVSVPFYSVGFLAAVSSAIAKEDMNILIVSTYSKDYILVKQGNLDKARKVLAGMGFKQA